MFLAMGGREVEGFDGGSCDNLGGDDAAVFLEGDGFLVKKLNKVFCEPFLLGGIVYYSLWMDVTVLLYVVLLLYRFFLYFGC